MYDRQHEMSADVTNIGEMYFADKPSQTNNQSLNRLFLIHPFVRRVLNGLLTLGPSQLAPIRFWFGAAKSCVQVFGRKVL